MTKDTDQTNGVITTQNISTVIRPKGNDNSLQFVKIQTPELSKKAAEQIKIAEEINKNSKEKIKEVEEEWQNNLLNWKSKRRQQFGHSVDYEPNNNQSFESSDSCNGQRKIKTFAEMLEQRAKSGNRRLSFHLQRYIGADDEDDDDDGEEDNGVGNDVDDDGDVGEDADERNLGDESAQLTKETNAESSDLGSTNTTATTATTSTTATTIEPDEVDATITSELQAASGRSESCESHNSRFEDQQEHKTEHTVEFTNNEVARSHNRHGHIRVGHSSGIHDELRKEEVDGHRSNNVGHDDEEEEEEDEYEEEELEEEEEQKRLQRIAFEAKLRAFEKLTIPATTQTPKFTPLNRNVKSPQSIQRKASADSNLPKELQYLNQQPQSQIQQQRVQQSQAQQPQPCHQQLRPQRSQLQLPLSQPEPKPQLHKPQIQQPQIPKPSLPQQQQQLHPQFQPQQLQHSPPQVHHHHQHHHHQQQQQQRLQQAAPPRIAEKIHVEPTPIVPSLPHNQNVPPPPLPPPQPVLQQTIQKQRNVPSSQLPPESPPKSMPAVQQQQQQQQRKSVRDEKDGTVLSVSGKKRCSSCKEELGRGAAAFVVESLSLVYHTNCFRCSVCHVNLSNGFRGVDVRVHAGALHCQNCYSKDGLNYSRV